MATYIHKVIHTYQLSGGTNGLESVIKELPDDHALVRIIHLDAYTICLVLEQPQ